MKSLQSEKVSKEIVIKRKVCLQNNCNLCNECDPIVPDSCPYYIIHALEDQVLEWKPRRWGKTTTIIKMANKYAESGHNVMLIFRTLAMWRHARESMNIHPDVEGNSIGSIRNYCSMRGRIKYKLFFDEIRPNDYARIYNEIQFCEPIRGYFT